MRLAKFLEFLKDRTGESLRAVEWYRDDDAELIYLRDDLDQAELQHRADDIHEFLTWDVDSSEMGDLQGLGEELASVSLREQAVLVHLPVSQKYGVVIGLEPEAARSLHGFVTECRETVFELDQGNR